jgi:hypothetical protein
MKDDIVKIIKDGVYAPSGENCQPWRFHIDGGKLSVFNIPEADQSLYNSKQKGSYTAHGALIENICISAKVHGYATEVLLFPDDMKPNLVALIMFTPHEKEHDDLYDSIPKRHTNRKEYTGKKLSNEEKKALIDSVASSGFGSFHIIDDEPTLKLLGAALAVNERVLFENKYIHKFFYDHILWDDKDEDKAGGFYIKTLEFLPHQLKAVKLFKNWSVLALLNSILGVSKMISKENGEKYAKSGTLGIIIANGTGKTDYVNAGRTLQRVWLTGTKLGLAMHPCTGAIYFMEQLQDNGGKEFSNFHQSLIRKAHADIMGAFGVSGVATPMLFRIGFAEKASARALRLDPMITYAS